MFGPKCIFKINCFLRRAIKALSGFYAAMQWLLIDNCCRTNYVIKALRQERAITCWKHEDYVVSVCCVQLEMLSMLCFDLNIIGPTFNKIHFLLCYIFYIDLFFIFIAQNDMSSVEFLTNN